MISLFQNLPKLCSVVAECVSAICIDFWLQTHLFQSGVLCHLLLYLFNYDFIVSEPAQVVFSGSRVCECILYRFLATNSPIPIWRTMASVLYLFNYDFIVSEPAQVLFRGSGVCECILCRFLATNSPIPIWSTMTSVTLPI